MTLPVLNRFINENFASQGEAAASLHISVQQLNRIVNGKTPPGWSLLGRMFYFWHNKYFFSSAINAMIEYGDAVYHRSSSVSDIQPAE